MTRRPIILLCLSDLHLIKDSSGQKALESFRKVLTSYATLSPEWKPDYIAVTGDFVVGKDQSENKYQVPEAVLDDLCKSFGLNRCRVIAVPGNHDKVIPQGDFCPDCPKIACVLPKFSQSRLSPDDVRCFLRSFSHFEQFAGFYSSYVDTDLATAEEDGYQYFYDGNVFSADCTGGKYTSGLKVFTKDKICFVCINTEWTYHPKEDQTGRKVRICAPIVRDSLNRIRNHYGDYLVVTLMHRNPAEFGWPERNEVNEHSDIVQSIYKASDIVLTGHDHNFFLYPPDRMANSAQLFRIGSSSRSDSLEDFVPYGAALLRIDPFERSVVVKSCSRVYGNKDQWEIVDFGRYPIRQLYMSSPKETFGSSGMEVLVSCRSRASVESAIKAVLGNCRDLLIVAAADFQTKDVEGKVRAKLLDGHNLHLVIYFPDYAMREGVRQCIDRLTYAFSSDIYRMRLVISDVLISYPQTE